MAQGQLDFNRFGRFAHHFKEPSARPSSSATRAWNSGHGIPQNEQLLRTATLGSAFLSPSFSASHLLPFKVNAQHGVKRIGG